MSPICMSKRCILIRHTLNLMPRTVGPSIKQLGGEREVGDHQLSQITRAWTQELSDINSTSLPSNSVELRMDLLLREDSSTCTENRPESRSTRQPSGNIERPTTGTRSKSKDCVPVKTSVERSILTFLSLSRSLSLSIQLQCLKYWFGTFTVR